MNKCLVTKLNGSVSNTELLRLGEMRVHYDKVSSPSDETQGFNINVANPVVLEIIGEGYFTDKTLTENKGKTLTLNSGANSIFVSNNELEVAILNKYDLISVSGTYTEGSIGTENKSLNIEDLKYSKSLKSIHLSSTKASGDIASLKNITALSNINLVDTQVSGDIASLKNLTALTSIGISGTQQIPLTGDISQLSTLSNCTDIKLGYSKLIGDLAILPSVCRFAAFPNDKGSVFTWSTRPSTAKIIAIGGNASLTNIDKMLQDQAQCQVGFPSSDDAWYKNISVAGNRTSASDDAVATLQQKGYTIRIAKA